jgi:hypothetical protein
MDRTKTFRESCVSCLSMFVILASGRLAPDGARRALDCGGSTPLCLCFSFGIDAAALEQK